MKQNKKEEYTISSARENFTDILNKASYAKDRIKILRRNKPIAYVVSVEDIERLEYLEDLADIKEAESVSKDDLIDLEDVKKEIS